MSGALRSTVGVSRPNGIAIASGGVIGTNIGTVHFSGFTGSTALTIANGAVSADGGSTLRAKCKVCLGGKRIGIGLATGSGGIKRSNVINGLCFGTTRALGLSNSCRFPFLNGITSNMSLKTSNGACKVSGIGNLG